MAKSIQTSIYEHSETMGINMELVVYSILGALVRSDTDIGVTRSELINGVEVMAL